jgi:enterochelin esterase-like enzyme
MPLSSTLARMTFAARLALATLALPALLHSQTPAPFHSTEVNPDHTVTFRYADPTATKADLALEGAGPNLPMEKDADGTWSATSKPLAPQIYGYHFDVDGHPRLDLHNTRLTTNLLSLSNLIDVPGEAPEPWEPQNIPHGEIHHHIYTTATVLGLPQNQSDFYVYTPPSYDPKAKRDYPVLYLLHGFSDRADGWTAVGQANLILDSLLAQGKIKPMIVVMPLGYGNMQFVLGHSNWGTPAAVTENTDLFSKALLTEVLPRVESEYRVSRKREDRAIAGLSMGGLESLSTGLNNTDKFAYVVGLSSAAASVDRDRLANLNPKSANLKLLWIACGTEDHLLDPNRQFIAFLKSKDMPVTAIETPGMHTWMVWRDNLIHFTPLLFQPK